jgi:integrase
VRGAADQLDALPLHLRIERERPRRRLVIPLLAPQAVALDRQGLARVDGEREPRHGQPGQHVELGDDDVKGTIARYVFCYTTGQKTGQRITESGFNKAWRKARVAAGCPGRIPHDFRRTAVRTLVRAGVPERVAMQLTGHKTRAVFERYNIVSSGDLRDAARRLDTYASGV